MEDGECAEDGEIEEGEAPMEEGEAPLNIPNGAASLCSDLFLFFLPNMLSSCPVPPEG